MLALLAPNQGVFFTSFVPVRYSTIRQGVLEVISHVRQIAIPLEPQYCLLGLVESLAAMVA